MGFCFKLVDEFGHHLRIQGLRLVNIVPLIKASDEFVASNGDGIRSGIGDCDATNSVVIEFDQSWTPLQMAKSSGHDCDHTGCIWIDVPGVLGRDGGRGEMTNGSLSSGNELVLNVRNGENLLSLAIIGHAKSVDQVDAQNVIVQMIADQEGAQGLSILVGGRECVGSMEFEFVVRSMIGLLGMREVLLEGLQG